MDLTLELKGVDKLMASNETFRKRLPGTVLNGIRRQVRRTITTVKKDIRAQSGIGRKIWGKKAKGLDKIVTLIRARAAGTSIETGIKLTGLPSIIESGGQIKPHKIQGTPWMSFVTKSGISVRIKTVNHPGAPVRSHDFARRALDRDSNLVVNEVRDGITKLIGATFGQSG